MLLPRIVVGLGPGRCGTWSLCKLLYTQRSVYSTHETVSGTPPMPWEPDTTEMWRQLYRLHVMAGKAKLIRKEPVKTIAPVAFFWISYVSEMVKMLTEPIFICLQRDRAEVIESFMVTSEAENPWTVPDSKSWTDKDVKPWWNCAMPNYDLPKEKAIAKYYDDYYEAAEFWQDRVPDIFRIFPVDTLNTKDGVESILDFAMIPKEDQVCHVGVRLNTRENSRGEIDV